LRTPRHGFAPASPSAKSPRRLGHSVETLVSIYVDALDGDDLAANTLIDTAMSGARSWMIEGA
jgi:hypothetical protein